MQKKMGYCLLLAVLFATRPMAQTQLKMLLQFKGYWETKSATLRTDGKEYKFAYSADFRATADNNGLTMIEKADIPGIGKLNGANLIGINADDGKVHWSSVDNLGTAHEHIGNFTDSKHFSMIYKGVQNGKEYMEKISVEFMDNGGMALREEVLIDGKEQFLITGVFHRIK